MILQTTAAALALVITLECLHVLRVLDAFKTMIAVGRKTPHLLRRRASDHLKERATRLLSLRLFSSSTRALLLLVLSTTPIALLLIVDSLCDLDVLQALRDTVTRLFIATTTIFYTFTRRKYRRSL